MHFCLKYWALAAFVCAQMRVVRIQFQYFFVREMWASFFCFSLERPLEIKARFFVQKVKTDLKAKKRKDDSPEHEFWKIIRSPKAGFLLEA